MPVDVQTETESTRQSIKLISVGPSIQIIVCAADPISISVLTELIKMLLSPSSLELCFVHFVSSTILIFKAIAQLPRRDVLQYLFLVHLAILRRLFSTNYLSRIRLSAKSCQVYEKYLSLANRIISAQHHTLCLSKSRNILNQATLRLLTQSRDTYLPPHPVCP
jgi:hypothetical protein